MGVSPTDPPTGEQSIGPVKRFGRYTLIKKLASGGMAEIWLARQTGVANFNRLVVVKKILSHLIEEEAFRNMFLDEARMTAQLSHPNIVQVFDLGQAEGTYFMAMEFITGENLATIAWRGLKKERPLSPVYAARILADTCKAMHYAHHLKGPNGTPLEIVHRDVSPQNILVTYEGEVKVIDFGIAKATTNLQITKTSTLKGKFSYMSPEQCLGQSIDKRSDIFALGIVLYELCTGKRLFKHESELMILEMITRRRIAPPSEIAENLPPGLEAIIMRALAKDQTERYQTAQELQLALEEFVRGQPSSATTTDVARYMRELFENKIDEKRRLCEQAMRLELPEEDFGEEATEQARAVHRGPGTTPRPSPSPGRRIVIDGIPLGTPVVAAPPPPRADETSPMRAAPFLTPGLPPHQTPFGAPPPGYSAPGAHSNLFPGTTVDEGTLWFPRLVIGLALAVILVAGGYLIRELFRPAPSEEQSSTPGAGAAARLGRVTVLSVPPGARVLLNDQALPGDPVTPLEIGNLVYGETYRLRVERTGHEPAEHVLVMGGAQDEQRIEVNLKPRPGTLQIVVVDDLATEVRVFVNGEPAGSGPLIERQVEPGELTVRAELPDHECAATPSHPAVAPGERQRVDVSCVRLRKRGGGTLASAGTKTPPVPEPIDECTRLAAGPPGLVNIATVPPGAEVFFKGRNLGETPLSGAQLPAGCVDLLVRAPDGRQKTFRVTITPNQTERYRFEL
ncbi:MAG: serine/threonine protein kinase [Deltaproteobacteria bacterium]|nr:serine/threonine protein kinase [Deltaproteobacteria bacterium]